jgi:hypothetical protein
MILFLLAEFAAYVFIRTFRFYTDNVHYNLVLPNLKIIIHMFEGFLFRQRNDEQPAGAKQAGCDLFNARLLRFFFKETTSCPLARKIISGALPNARSLQVYLKYNDMADSNLVTTAARSISYRTPLIHELYKTSANLVT